MSVAGSTTHVLVADDEPHIGRIIKMKLEQGPFRVTLAYDGPEALDVLAREPDVSLVFLDLMMPGMSGLDVLAQNIIAEPRPAGTAAALTWAAAEIARRGSPDDVMISVHADWAIGNES